MEDSEPLLGGDEADKNPFSDYGTPGGGGDDDQIEERGGGGDETGPVDQMWGETAAVTDGGDGGKDFDIGNGEGEDWVDTGTKITREKRKISASTYVAQVKEKMARRRERILTGIPKRSCCHKIFILLNVVAVTACLCMGLSQVLPLILFWRPALVEVVLRSYLAFFCILFIIGEIEAPVPFIRSSESLHNFITKGVLFIFLAVVGLEQSLVSSTQIRKDVDKMLKPYGEDVAEGAGQVAIVFIEVSSWFMLGVGILYVVLGLLCMKGLRDRCRVNYAQRMEDYFSKRRSQRVTKVAQI